MSMATASEGGDIRQKALNMQCVSICTLRWCCALEVWAAVVRHVFGMHWDVSGHRVRVAKLTCIVEILSKERVKININAQL